MQRAILISQDVRFINEFTQICAVTGMELVIEHSPSAVDLRAVYFLDASTQGITEELPHVHVVCVGQPDSHVWLLASQVNAESIITFPHDRAQLVNLLTPQLKSAANVIAVTHAAGGVGATTLAMATAHQLKNSGYSCVLLDVADHYSGLDLSVGLHDQDVIYSGNIMNSSQFGIEGLNTVDGLSCITNNATHTPQQWSELINYLGKHFDYVVLDIESKYLQTDLVEICDDIIVGLTNTIRDIAVTKILLNSLPKEHVGLAIRSIPGAALQPLAIAEKLQTPLWASLPTDKRITEQIECGFGVSMVKLASFTRSIAQLVSRLVQANSHAHAA